jgi:hypothetical protein
LNAVFASAEVPGTVDPVMAGAQMDEPPGESEERESSPDDDAAQVRDFGTDPDADTKPNPASRSGKGKSRAKPEPGKDSDRAEDAS